MRVPDALATTVTSAGFPTRRRSEPGHGPGTRPRSLEFRIPRGRNDPQSPAALRRARQPGATITPAPDRRQDGLAVDRRDAHALEINACTSAVRRARSRDLAGH